MHVGAAAGRAGEAETQQAGRLRVFRDVAVGNDVLIGAAVVAVGKLSTRPALSSADTRWVPRSPRVTAASWQSCGRRHVGRDARDPSNRRPAFSSVLDRRAPKSTGSSPEGTGLTVLLTAPPAARVFSDEGYEPEWPVLRLPGDVAGASQADAAGLQSRASPVLSPGQEVTNSLMPRPMCRQQTVELTRRTVGTPCLVLFRWSRCNPDCAEGAIVIGSPLLVASIRKKLIPSAPSRSSTPDRRRCSPEYRGRSAS